MYFTKFGPKSACYLKQTAWISTQAEFGPLKVLYLWSFQYFRHFLTKKHNSGLHGTGSSQQNDPHHITYEHVRDSVTDQHTRSAGSHQRTAELAGQPLVPCFLNRFTLNTCGRCERVWREVCRFDFQHSRWNGLSLVSVSEPTNTHEVQPTLISVNQLIM